MLKEDIWNHIIYSMLHLSGYYCVCNITDNMISALLFNILIIFTINYDVLGAPSTESDYLEAKGRNLQQVPQGHSHIKSLNLAYNRLELLPDYVFFNNSLRALEKIELYHNQIATIQLNAFKGLRHLCTVDLADNNLTEIDPYVFRSNAKLEKLDLSGNQINFTRSNVFIVSSSLESLILSSNRIDQIYEVTFMGVTNVENLILDNNNALVMIAANSFKPLKNLQYLSLANTGVYRLSESMFGQTNNLPRIVDLQGTPLSKRFDPPLKKITNNAVTSLIRLDEYIFGTKSDTTIQ